MAMLESGEMYLETIYILSKKSSAIRGIDIGEYMGYTKPSVSRAVGLLKKSGLIGSDKDGYIVLTEEGKKRAARIYERHTVLTKLFINLGVSEKTAADDACLVEHHLSDETFAAIKKHIKKFELE